MTRVLLAAGGTGGHVFPALATGLALRDIGAEVIWAGRPDSLESRVAVENGFGFEALAAGGFFGKGLVDKVGAIWLLARGFFLATGLLRRLAPGGVVATGGFATAALLAGAGFASVPYFLLEQNCVPGRVTRHFAPRARESFLAFPTRQPFPGPSRPVGNPLRRELAANGRNDDGKTVLFIGGSGGARSLSMAALDAAAALSNLNFVVVAGKRDYEFIKTRVRSANCEVIEFTAHPEDLYRRATVAVSRSGGVALSELLAFGIPAILVPFPFATDRHQDANAEYAVSVGAASLLDQNRLSGLTSLVRTLMDDTAGRKRMSAAARAAARPDAAQEIARRVIEVLTNSEGRS